MMTAVDSGDDGGDVVVEAVVVVVERMIMMLKLTWHGFLQVPRMW